MRGGNRGAHFDARRDCIIGIETSCDDTGVAVLSFPRGRPDGAAVIASDVINAQHDLHAGYGGIVPRLAARAHATNLPSAIDAALRAAGVQPPPSPHRVYSPHTPDTDDGAPSSPGPRVVAVAVTIGPGLAMCLQAGLTAATQLAATYGVPLLPINHLEAHLLVARLASEASSHAPLHFPYLVLLASGGHTLLAVTHGEGHCTLLASTLDDALGEATDKVARCIDAEAALAALRRSSNHLDANGCSSSNTPNHPPLLHAGAVLEALALYGNAAAVRLPVPLRTIASPGASPTAPSAAGTSRCAFSFAGLKSAVARYTHANEQQREQRERERGGLGQVGVDGGGGGGGGGASQRRSHRQQQQRSPAPSSPSPPPSVSFGATHPRLAADIAASFQATAAVHVCDQLRRAAAYVSLQQALTASPAREGTGAVTSHAVGAGTHDGGSTPPLRHVVVCGGVAANLVLRRAVSECAASVGLTPVFPPPRLCTDNGVMIAWAGLERLRVEAGRGEWAPARAAFAPGSELRDLVKEGSEDVVAVAVDEQSEVAPGLVIRPRLRLGERL